jgi:hypothetical protein
MIKEFPKATVVGVADGARDNWEFLNEVTDRQIIRGAALTNNRWNAFWRKISLYGVVIEAVCAA